MPLLPSKDYLYHGRQRLSWVHRPGVLERRLAEACRAYRLWMNTGDPAMLAYGKEMHTLALGQIAQVRVIVGQADVSER